MKKGKKHQEILLNALIYFTCFISENLVIISKIVRNVRKIFLFLFEVESVPWDDGKGILGNGK